MGTSSPADEFKGIKEALKKSVQALCYDKGEITSRFYINDILIPDIKKLEKANLSNKDQAEHILAYLQGGAGNKKKLVKLIDEYLTSLQQYRTSFTNEIQYNKEAKLCIDFLNNVKKIRSYHPKFE